MPTRPMLDQIVVEEKKGPYETREAAVDALVEEMIDEANKLLGQALRMKSLMKPSDEELPF